MASFDSVDESTDKLKKYIEKQRVKIKEETYYYI